jgi:dimethylhistidine N-methyltransferase
MTSRPTDPGYRVLGPAELGKVRHTERELAHEVLVGLSERPKRLPSRFFYDDAGSRLFQRIMGIDEYYLTGCERRILETHAGAIVERVAKRPVDVIDLGAGDGAKTTIVLSELARQNADYRYVPIDISEGAMADLVVKMRARLPSVNLEGVVSEYGDALEWLALERAQATGDPRAVLVLFLGSNIGNFDLPHARAFLRRLWNSLRPGDHVLVGFDLKKDIDILLRAYNDSEGVTACFNLNLLTRINRELGGTFDISRFRHFGTYDVFTGAMKSYLVSLEAQTVWIEALRHAFTFQPWEPVHTEYSYKYLRSDIDALANDTGFSIEASYFDGRRWFVDSLWRVAGANRV